MQGRRYIGVAVLGVSEQCCIIGVAAIWVSLSAGGIPLVDGPPHRWQRCGVGLAASTGDTYPLGQPTLVGKSCKILVRGAANEFRGYLVHGVV